MEMCHLRVEGFSSVAVESIYIGKRDATGRSAGSYDVPYLRGQPASVALNCVSAGELRPYKVY